MADVKWIKIVTDIFDDEKIQLIEGMPEADGIIVIWFKLLCLAGKQNNNGVFMMNERLAFTDEMLSTLFRRKQNVVKLALVTFEQFGMIEIVKNVITIPNWEKHQNTDGLDRIREKARLRVKKYRDKKNMELLENRERECNVTVTLPVTSPSQENNNSPSTSLSPSTSTSIKRFVRPSIEELNNYIDEKGYDVDAEQFIAFYDSNGWKVGKNPMKSWKGAVTTWGKRNGLKPKSEKEKLDEEWEAILK